MIRNLMPPKNDVGYVSGRLPCVKFISKRGVVCKGDVSWIRKNQSVQTSFTLTTGMPRHLLNLPFAPMFLSSVVFVQLAAQPSGHTASMPISRSATNSLLLPTFLSMSSYLNLRRMACIDMQCVWKTQFKQPKSYHSKKKKKNVPLVISQAHRSRLPINSK